MGTIQLPFYEFCENLQLNESSALPFSRINQILLTSHLLFFFHHLLGHYPLCVEQSRTIHDLPKMHLSIGAPGGEQTAIR